MPIQTSCFEKSKFQSTQATNFGRLLGVAVHQIFKSSVPTQNVPAGEAGGRVSLVPPGENIETNSLGSVAISLER